MSIAFPATAGDVSTSAGGSGTITLNIPANTTAGDLLVVWVEDRTGLSSPSAGWTQQTLFTTTGVFACYTQFISGSPPGSAFSITAASGSRNGGVMFRVTGCDSSNPVYAVGATSGAGNGANPGAAFYSSTLPLILSGVTAPSGGAVIGLIGSMYNTGTFPSSTHVPGTTTYIAAASIPTAGGWGAYGITPQSGATGNLTCGTDWPTGGSGEQGILLALQAAAPPVTSYTLHSGGTYGLTNSGNSTPYVFGVEFEVPSSVSLTGIWFYSGPAATSLPTACALYNASTGVQISGTLNSAPTWSGAAGSGWVKCTYSGLSLSSRTKYVAAVAHGSAVYYQSANYWTSGAGSSGITNGPLTAPASGSAVNGQAVYTSGPGMAFPNSTVSGYDFGVDVEVTPVKLIQAVAGNVTGNTLNITITPTGAGNCLVALIGNSADTTNGTISGITLGGSADNWVQAAIQGNGSDHAIVTGWVDPNCAVGQTSVAISTTGGTGDHLFGWVFEFSGLSGTLDKSSGGANGFASSWTSGTTSTTAQAFEVAFGITCGASSGTPVLAGPASPWVNEAQQTLSGSAHIKAAVAGYQILSSTQTITYAGTASPTNTNDTLVFTLRTSWPPASPSGMLIAGII